MKELSIEEKAKCYDEAKARISKAYNNNRCTFGFMNEIFPELAESEDDRIKKRIIQAIKLREKDMNEEWSNEIAWIEKQGEQPKKVSIWKHWSGNGIAGNGDGKKIYLTKRGYTYEVSSCLAFECDYIELSELDNLMQEEKQDEQKSEWSEEDEKMVIQLLCIVYDCQTYGTYSLKLNDYTDIYNWLNSLRYRKHWKPNEEQINAFEATLIAMHCTKEKEIMFGLLEQLKAL